VVAGIVLDPSRDELFWAERGAGAWLGDRRLSTTPWTRLQDAVIHTGVPHRGRGDHATYLEQLRAVMARVAGIRRMGAAAR
jgi:myo-inositol-1(or 4)-monophosphatase